MFIQVQQYAMLEHFHMVQDGFQFPGNTYKASSKLVLNSLRKMNFLSTHIVLFALSVEVLRLYVLPFKAQRL